MSNPNDEASLGLILGGVAVLGVFIWFMLGSLPGQSEDKPTLSSQKICKGAIAALFGREPGIIRTRGDSIVHAHYTRSDGTFWDYKCRVEGNRVIWGASDGRWRTHPLDAKVSYVVGASTVTITESYDNGQSASHSFNISEL